jgi:hypothetical protein
LAAGMMPAQSSKFWLADVADGGHCRCLIPHALKTETGVAAEATAPVLLETEHDHANELALTAKCL